MHYEIRNYHITDLSALYKICLQTANNGSDASSLLKDSDLAGHLFAAPYAFFEPELCFILSLDANPYGYVLGAKNSVDFLEKCEKNWFPQLRKRFTLPDEKDKSLQSNFIRFLHQKQDLTVGLKDYPAHLHIDILPAAQGKGYGRQLIQAFVDQLKVLNIKGVHLIVSKQNSSAIGFYEHIGFQELKNYGESLVLVKAL